MKYIIYFHLLYLCLIPFLGAFAVLSVDYNSYILRFVGWIPGVVFTAIIIDEYSIPKNILKAIGIVTLVPLEIILHIFVFNGALADFLIEAGFVAMFTLTIAMATTMVIFRPSGIYGAVVGIILSLIVILGMGLPLFELFVSHNYHYTTWIALVIICLSGLWSNLRVFAPHALAWIGGKAKVPRFLDRLFYSDDNDEPANLKISIEVIIIAYVVLWFVVFMTPFSSIFFDTPV